MCCTVMDMKYKLSKFNKGQNITAMGLGQSISERAQLIGCLHSIVMSSN